MALGTLQTARLLIRPLAPGDLEPLHHLLDEDLRWGGPGVTLDQRRERMALQIMLARWEDTGCLYGDRAIVLQATGELIGICGFRPWMCTPAERTAFNVLAAEHAFSTPELGVGYALSSAHRGRGYATEAVKALIRYAFDEVKVRRVVALTFRGNHASIAVMRRAGMDVGMNPDPAAVYPWAVGLIENRGRPAPASGAPLDAAHYRVLLTSGRARARVVLDKIAAVTRAREQGAALAPVPAEEQETPPTGGPAPASAEGQAPPPIEGQAPLPIEEPAPAQRQEPPPLEGA